MDFAEYIRTHSSELLPIETGETPVLTKFTGIKAVVFDIYGTIMVSAAGDISLAGGGESPGVAMAATLAAFGLKVDPGEALANYDQIIEAQQRAREVEYPEVEIREVWSALLTQLGGDPELAAQVSVAYECAVNPVWPMPGLIDNLEAIRSSGRWLGVISNGQFYSPILFPALTGKSLEALGVSPELMIYSYRMKEGKPSRTLYHRMAVELAAKGISPHETLYIGNDLFKDVWPAGLEGFKTALFAGDRRSLRWRKGDQRLTGVKPDAVITELKQVVELLS